MTTYPPIVSHPPYDYGVTEQHRDRAWSGYGLERGRETPPVCYLRPDGLGNRGGVGGMLEERDGEGGYERSPFPLTSACPECIILPRVKFHNPFNQLLSLRSVCLVDSNRITGHVGYDLPYWAEGFLVFGERGSSRG